MNEDLISDIRKRHEHDAMMTDFLRVPKLHWAQTPAGWWAHRDRATLLAEAEKLTRERDEARSKETDYREGFQEGWDAAHEGTAAVVKKLREALKEWDALIVHQFHGSRDAMSDMQRAALNTKRILDELDAREALEAKQ